MSGVDGPQSMGREVLPAPFLILASFFGLTLSSCATVHAPLQQRLSDGNLNGNWVTSAIAGDPYIQATEPQYTFETLIGARELDADSAWAPLDSQFNAGISWQPAIFGVRDPDHWLFGRALSWDFGVHYAYDRSDLSGPIRSGRLVSRMIETSGGLILEPPDPTWRLRPYVGAGFSILFTDVALEGDIDPFREKDTATGGYLRTGARFQWTSRQHFGIDLRWLFGTEEPIDGIGSNADAMTVSFLFGARF